MEIFDPIEPSNYNLLEPKSTAREIKRLTKDVYEAVKPGIFHLEDRALDSKFNTYLDRLLYDRFPKFYPVVDNDPTMQQRGKKLVDIVDGIGADQSIEKRIWKSDLSWTHHLAYYLLAPFAFFGYLINFIPNRMAKNFARRKVEKEGFIAPIIVAMNVAYYIGYLLIIIALGLFFHPIFFILILLIPLLGRIYLYHLDLRERFSLQKYYNGLDEMKRKSLEKLKNRLC